MLKRQTFYSVGIFTCAALLGCSEKTVEPGDGNGRSGLRIKLVPSLSSKPNAAKKVAPSGANGLEQFEVAVANISIAKNLTTQGSGFSNMSGAFSLFSQNLGDYNTFDTNQARSSDMSAKYIDFCSQQGLEKIATSHPFTIKDTGSYHWAIINWAPIFKVRASIPLAGGETIYTKDGYVTPFQYPNTTGQDGRYFVTIPKTTLLSGPSESALVRKNNGGTWFRFLKPLRLTEADLDTGNTIADTIGRDSTGKPIVQQLPSGKWNVMLVFNPEDLLFASKDDKSNGSVTASILSPDSSAFIHVPFLKATAIPYRDGESVMRETYRFTVNIDKPWAKGKFGMRLELYLIGDNVVAANVHSYPIDGNLAPSEVPVIFFADEAQDGSLSLQNYNRKPVFDGFKRMTTKGEKGSVKWDASSHQQDVQTLEYELDEIKKMR